MSQKRASRHTIAAYRDGFRLLIALCPRPQRESAVATGVRRSRRPVIGAFLDHLANATGATTPRPGTPPGGHPLAVPLRGPAPPRARRPHRTGARHPAQAIRPDHRAFLTTPETDALLAAPDRDRWTGRRDHALLASPSKPGCGSPNSPGSCQDAQPGTGAHVRCRARDGTTVYPAHALSRRVLAAWMRERAGEPGDPLFPTSRGRALSRDAIALLVTKYATIAAQTARHCAPNLSRRTLSVTPAR